MKIEVEKITEYQKLTIVKGLYDYQYIMNNWKKVNDNDFYKVYYNFYLSARGGVMRNESNKNPYFAKLRDISLEENFIKIISELKEEMESKSYEFSLVTKLLHTKNPSMPIYDSKVREYLAMNEEVEFWWYRRKGMYGSSAKRGTSEIKKIEHDWKNLCEWYSKFLASERGKNWIKWFDTNFPEFINISNVKKVDFIIFATN